MPKSIIKEPKKRIISNLLLQNWLIDEVLESLQLPLTKITRHARLVKIIKFLQISFKNGVKLIISDADHLILCEIPKRVYLEHERKLKTRFTTNNKNIIIVIQQYKLKFYSKQEVFKQFGMMINCKELLPKYCVLEITKFEFFNRDEVRDNCNLPWIYNDNRYQLYRDEIISDEIDPFPLFE